MYFDALKTFVTLVEVKNFTKTSEILHISQPSVSLHIKNLEAAFQTQLFIRSPKSVHVTPTGEILYQRAKQIFSIYEQSREEILDHHQAVQGKLMIGASFTIGECILPTVIANLHEKFPLLEYEILIGNTAEIVEHVQLLKVDIGLIEGQANEKELTVRPFMQDTLVIVASHLHPLANQPIVTIDDLQNQKWVTREKGSGTGEYLNHFLRTHGLNTHSMLTISSNQGVKECVMQNLGLSLLSFSVVERELKYGELRLINMEQETFSRTFSYVYSPVMKDKKNVRTFIETLHRIETGKEDE